MTVLILGGLIDSQLEKLVCTFAGITSDSVDPGGLNDSQLEKSVCTFAGITCDSVDPGGSTGGQSTWAGGVQGVTNVQFPTDNKFLHLFNISLLLCYFNK